MTKKVLLRCNNQSLHIEADPVTVNRFVDWILEHNYQTQRYPENKMDVFEFTNPKHLVACKLKAIKMELLPVATCTKS